MPRPITKSFSEDMRILTVASLVSQHLNDGEDRASGHMVACEPRSNKYDALPACNARAHLQSVP